jgi:hypothetical protein
MMGRGREGAAAASRDAEIDELLGRTRRGVKRALLIEDLDGSVFKDAVQKVVAKIEPPWTIIRLKADFTTTSATAVDVPGLGFPCGAHRHYEFVADLLLRTATTTVGPRPGIKWPTGLADGAATIRVPTAAGTEAMTNGTIAAAILAPVGGLPDTTNSYLAVARGLLVAGASPVGPVQIQIASETGGTTVTVKAGSVIRFRAID